METELFLARWMKENYNNVHYDGDLLPFTWYSVSLPFKNDYGLLSFKELSGTMTYYCIFDMI